MSLLYYVMAAVTSADHLANTLKRNGA